MADFVDRFGPWYPRGSANVEDRRDDPWPWHGVTQNVPQQSLTPEATGDFILGNIERTTPVPRTPLGVAAGLPDIQPMPDNDVIKFLLNIDQLNPDPPGRKVSNGGR